MDGKPSFEHIFRLTGFHLGAAGLGFFVAAWIFAPKPRAPAALSPRVAQILELRTLARAVASATPSAAPSTGTPVVATVGVGTAGAPGAASAASAVAGPPAAALARATELCKALAWPACDADSVRAMGRLP